MHEAPGKGLYRLLGARAALKLRRYTIATDLAQWVLDAKSGAYAQEREVEDWQYDWANLIKAQATLHSNTPKRGEAMLRGLLQAADVSVRLMASHLLKQRGVDEGKE